MFLKAAIRGFILASVVLQSLPHCLKTTQLLHESPTSLLLSERPVTVNGSLFISKLKECI